MFGLGKGSSFTPYPADDFHNRPAVAKTRQGLWKTFGFQDGADFVKVADAGAQSKGNFFFGENQFHARPGALGTIAD